ncbi:MAG: hypothetical protein A2Y38_15480 [Spirochaetes bacterium GWB1_59_5]|nr:MAG: hypothetical protein A2Y38_15480 [Spirochaetes bacterium GWB1_59_5]
MTDQEKKSLRSFLKEMEDSLAKWKDFEITSHVQGLYVNGRKDEVRQHISSFREMFAETIFPTCEVCNLPVSDEDSAGPGSNLHKECCGNFSARGD